MPSHKEVVSIPPDVHEPATAIGDATANIVVIAYSVRIVATNLAVRTVFGAIIIGGTEDCAGNVLLVRKGGEIRLA